MVLQNLQSVYIRWINAKLLPNNCIFKIHTVYFLFNHASFFFFFFNILSETEACNMCHFQISLAWKYIFLIKLLIKFNIIENNLERSTALF